MNKLLKKFRRRSGKRNPAKSARSECKRKLFSERLEDRMLLAGDLSQFSTSAAHNYSFPADVNGDGSHTPLDVLAGINDLNANGARAISTGTVSGAESEGSLMYDVNDDGSHTPADVLRGINLLNAEGEPGPVIRVITRILERPANYPFELQQDIDHDFNPATPVTDALVKTPALTEIDSIGVGQDFVVQVLVEDIRSMGTREGVFSAYVDVNFDGILASVVDSLPDALHPQTVAATPYVHNFDYFALNSNSTVTQTYARNFGGIYGQRAEPITGTNVIDTNNDQVVDQIDLLGSFSGSLVGPGAGEFVLVEFVMTATAEGTLEIGAEPATEPPANDPNDDGASPLFDAGIFGQDAPVCPSESTQDPCMGEIEFVSDTVTIVSDLAAVPNELTFDEGASGTVDVLANDIVNNPPGALPALVSFTDPANITVSRNTQGTTTQTDDTLTVTPDDPNFNGQVVFSYTISNGDGGSSTSTADVTVNITPVNDSPVNSVPGPQTINEDATLTFNGNLSTSDADGNVQVELLLTAGNGLVSLDPGDLGSLTFFQGDGTADAAIIARGTVNDVNNALNGASYTPSQDFNGSATLTFSIDDMGNIGGGALSDTDTVNITINPINDDPVNTVPGPQSLFNTETLSFAPGDFQVADVDATTLEVTLSVTDGTVSLTSTSGLQVTGNNTSSLTINGLISNLNSGLGSLVYDPVDSFIGTDTLTMTTSDLGQGGSGGTLTDTDTVSLTVSPPTTPFAAADSFEIEEDPSTALTFSRDDLLEFDIAADDNTLSLTLINNMAPSTGPFTTSQNGSLTYDPNTGGFAYDPPANFFGVDTFTYTIEQSPDPGNGPSTATVSIDVKPINDGPSNTVPGPLSVNEDDVFSFSGANLISVEDIDAGSAGVTVTLTVNDGTINVSGGGTVTDNGTSFVTIEGTVDQVNSSLGGLTYTPDTDFFGSDSLSISTNDNGNTGGVPGNPDADTPLSDNDTVNITIDPINDAPTIVVPGSQSFFTDFDNRFTDPFTVSDVDSGTNDVQVDLTIGDGSLTLSPVGGVSIQNNGSSSVRLTGPIAGINDTLDSLIYNTSIDGDKTLSATINDLGNTGDGGELTDSGTVDIEVLDFVPVDIMGKVYADVDNSGTPSSQELGIEGVEVTLSGTDNRGNPVTVSTRTDGHGSYGFIDQSPGTYTVTAKQPFFLIDGKEDRTSVDGTTVRITGKDEFSLDLPSQGLDEVDDLNFGELGIKSEYLDLNFFRNTRLGQPGIIIATDAVTSDMWGLFLGPWPSSVGSPKIEMESDGSYTLRLKRNDTTLSFNVPAYQVSTIRNESGETTYIRVDPEDFGLGGGEGEGEGGDDLAMQDAREAEQFKDAVDSILACGVEGIA